MTTSGKGVEAARKMSLDEVETAALSDPDARPLTDADLARMKRTPQVKVIRRALRLSQEEFAGRYSIPLATLQDWEEGRSEPDQPAKAYLRVIGNDPEGVSRALSASRNDKRLATTR